MPDSDGTISIPWWAKLVVKLVPSPFGQILAIVLDIIDKLPAPKQSQVLAAAVQSNLRGDPAILTGALHVACTDPVGCPNDVKGL